MIIPLPRSGPKSAEERATAIRGMGKRVARIYCLDIGDDDE